MKRFPSEQQIALLRRLPDSPSDGLRCTQTRRTAESLCRRGEARCVGEHEIFHTRRYVRTEEGRRTLAIIDGKDEP
jgi:hypothetical protein